MKKIYVLLMVVLLFTMSACSTGNLEEKNPDVGVDKNQKIIIYSNSASEGRSEWLTEKAKEEGFNIEVVSLPGGELTNRLIAEKNNSIADMVYGLNTVEYEKLKAENLLQKYDAPSWTEEVDMSLGDAEGYYYPIVVQPLVGIVNADIKTPKDWVECATNPELKDKYFIFGLGGGTAKNMLSALLVQYADPNGELGISSEGWEIAKNYIQNAHIEIKGEDYVGSVIDGSRPIAQLWGSGVIQNQKERNYKFNLLVPEVGVPFVVEQTAILSTTSKAKLCEEFIEWFGSATIQAEWSNKFGSIPANQVALKSASEEVLEFMSQVHPQEMDWKLVSQYIDQWVEKVELEFIK